MRKWLNEDVLPRLPKELQAMIVPRTIRQMIDGKEVQTQDKLWLPSFTEMFGAEAAAEWTPGDLGDEQFELFASERSRVKESSREEEHGGTGLARRMPASPRVSA